MWSYFQFFYPIPYFEMTTPNPANDLVRNEIPEQWRAEVESQLMAGENALTSVEVDLDARLHFVQGLLLLTNQRLLARAPGETTWRNWPIRKELQLSHYDHAGVGRLELTDESGRLAEWRFTLGHNLRAIRLLDQYQLLRESHATGEPVEREDQDVCPNCKAPLEPDQDDLSDLHQGHPYAAIDLDPVPAMALCQALPQAIGSRLYPDPGRHCRQHGHALPRPSR